MSADDLLYAPVNSSGGGYSVTNTAQIGGDLRLPQSWIDTIQKIRNWNSVWQNATIAGGALRDLDLGRPVKDIDIFLPCVGGVPTPLTALEKCFQVPLNGMYIDEINHDPSHNSALSNGVLVPSHFEFRIDGWKFEITQKVEAFTHRSILDSFDLGICMISLDGLSIYRSPEYLLDAARKQITVVRSTGGRERIHANRIGRKYSDWQVIG